MSPSPSQRPHRQVSDVTDKALLFAGLAELSIHGQAFGIVKEQKFAHRAEFDLLSRNVGGLRYTFIKDHMGPVSPQIYDDMDLFMAAGLWSDHPQAPTSDGLEFLKELRPLLGTSQNAPIWRTVQSVAERYGPLTPQECKVAAYELPAVLNNGKKVPMKDAAHHTVVLSAPGSAPGLHVTPGWRATLEVWLNPGARRNIDYAIKRAREGPSAPWARVTV